jgi:GTP-binding protein LepA
MPEPVKTDRIEEPFIRAQIITQAGVYRQYHDLCLGKRGILTNQQLPHANPRGA